MTLASRNLSADASPSVTSQAPASWRELRADDSIQFEDIGTPEPEPREPTWFDDFLEFLADLFAPIGKALAAAWPVLSWVLLAAAIALVLFLIWRMINPYIGDGSSSHADDDGEPEWAPDRAESLALLEEADRLAAEGKYDEATHLLLKRSVGQIAEARPEWVVPASTARELAALPKLSDAARKAFRTIAVRVERSLFAMSALDQSDWDEARAAYADFALARIEGKASAEPQGLLPS